MITFCDLQISTKPGTPRSAPRYKTTRGKAFEMGCDKSESRIPFFIQLRSEMTREATVCLATRPQVELWAGFVRLSPSMFFKMPETWLAPPWASFKHWRGSLNIHRKRQALMRSRDGVPLQPTRTQTKMEGSLNLDRGKSSFGPTACSQHAFHVAAREISWQIAGPASLPISFFPQSQRNSSLRLRPPYKQTGESFSTTRSSSRELSVVYLSRGTLPKKRVKGHFWET